MLKAGRRTFCSRGFSEALPVPLHPPMGVREFPFQLRLPDLPARVLAAARGVGRRMLLPCSPGPWPLLSRPLFRGRSWPSRPPRVRGRQLPPTPPAEPILPRWASPAWQLPQPKGSRVKGPLALSASRRHRSRQAAPPCHTGRAARLLRQQAPQLLDIPIRTRRQDLAANRRWKWSAWLAAWLGG